VVGVVSATQGNAGFLGFLEETCREDEAYRYHDELDDLCKRENRIHL
jgi:hypothetical protein